MLLFEDVLFSKNEKTKNIVRECIVVYWKHIFVKGFVSPKVLVLGTDKNHFVI